MVRILFFAQTRELIETEMLTLECSGITITQLLEQLAKKGDKWHLALKEKTVLCAVNQRIVDSSYVIQSGDEIAFFPPVTGG